ncbi:MAG TPA: hypothetical protein VFC19_37190 [Candidatus Limnocylindrales bacterium]|nr:hypothetical protein [Candidatus Limnocylindrales bacterium]
MWKHLAVLTCCLGLAAGCISGPAGQQGQRTREQRVADEFGRMAPDIAVKESMPSQPQPAYVLVDEDRAGDGRVRSLWATNPGQTLSRCYYLDTERDGQFVHGAGGCGGGGDQGRTVTLNGAVADLVGDVGAWPASSVSISGGGLEATVPVKNGYFLVPVRVTTAGARTYDVRLLDNGSKVIGEAADVKAP